MNIATKILLPLSIATICASCESVADKAAKEYCSINNKSIKEYCEIANEKNETIKMSKLDSMAYRDIFETTHLAKDSNAISEFNNIAAQYRNNQFITDEEIHNFQMKKAFNENMSYKDFESIKNYKVQWLRQSILDNFAYQKFFKEKGVLSEDVKNMCSKYQNNLKLVYNNKPMIK